MEVMETVYEPCIHVNEYKEDKSCTTYEVVHALFVACITEMGLKAKSKHVKCKALSCKEDREKKKLRKGRIYACLSCKYFGCYEKKHIHEHSEKKNHALGVDTNSGAVFCFICNDIQYDSEFERISRQQFSRPVCPRGWLTINKWMPTIEQIDILMEEEHEMIDLANLEFRGLTNMGKTCYISVIFQSLIHSPVFRNYFLSLNHKCDSKVETFHFFESVIEDPPTCYTCQVSEIVQECLSGDEGSFALDDFLLFLWINYENFRGYDEQDAFLFYLNLIEGLHTSLPERCSSELFCQCGIDIIFSGSEKFVSTCNICGTSSSSLHPLKVVHFNSVPENKTDANEVSFLDCLEKNLHDVVLDYDCEKCGKKVNHEREKIYERLPLICGFQLNISDASFSKVTKKLKKKKEAENLTVVEENPEANQGVIVRFEEQFDMTPYKLSFKDRSEKLHEMKPDPLNFFYLFAVVEYKGVGQKGHYICYVKRNSDKWFKCDDEHITPISIEEVKKIVPYILFYQRPVDTYSKSMLLRAAERSIELQTNQPKVESQSDESTEELQTNQLKMEPQSDKSTEESQSDKSTEESQSDKSTEESQSDESTEESQSDESTEESQSDESTEELQSDQSTVELQIDKLKIEPQTNKPTTELQTNQPTVELQTTQSTVELPTKKPKIEPQTDEPTVEPQTNKPTVEPQTNKPTVELQTNQPTIKLRTNLPTVELQTNQPIIEFQTSQPTNQLNEPEL